MFFLSLEASCFTMHCNEYWALLKCDDLTDVCRKVHMVYWTSISCNIEVWRIIGQWYISLKTSYSWIEYGFLCLQSSVKSSEYVIYFSTFSVFFEILSFSLPVFCLFSDMVPYLLQIGISLPFPLNCGISKKMVLGFCFLYIFDSHISVFNDC